MSDEEFDRDLRQVIGDYADVEPPAALMKWLGNLSTNAARPKRSIVGFVKPLVAAAAVLVVGAVVASSYWAQSGSSAVPLPSGQPLTIVTEPAPYYGGACQLALARGVEMRVSGSEIVFSQSGHDIALTWPYGTKALLVDGKAELFEPDGSLIGVEGETLPDLSGGLGTDDRFAVCAVNNQPINPPATR